MLGRSLLNLTVIQWYGGIHSIMVCLFIFIVLIISYRE